MENRKNGCGKFSFKWCNYQLGGKSLHKPTDFKLLCLLNTVNKGFNKDQIANLSKE